MYDNVAEHPDFPRFVIDDDVLDGWFIFQKEREKKQAEFDNRNNKKMDNAQEVFLMVNENQSAEEIMDLNDPMAKARFQSKMNYLKQNRGKEIEESKLPDVQMDIMNQRAENQRINKR